MPRLASLIAVALILLPILASAEKVFDGTIIKVSRDGVLGVVVYPASDLAKAKVFSVSLENEPSETLGPKLVKQKRRFVWLNVLPGDLIKARMLPVEVGGEGGTLSSNDFNSITDLIVEEITKPATNTLTDPNDKNPIVYTIPRSTKFHASSCYHLRGSKSKAIRLNEALVAGFGPCQRCAKDVTTRRYRPSYAIGRDKRQLPERIPLLVGQPDSGMAFQDLGVIAPLGTSGAAGALSQSLWKDPNSEIHWLTWQDSVTGEQRAIIYDKGSGTLVRTGDHGMTETWTGMTPQGLGAAASGDSLNNWGDYWYETE